MILVRMMLKRNCMYVAWILWLCTEKSQKVIWKVIIWKMFVESLLCSSKWYYTKANLICPQGIYYNMSWLIIYWNYLEVAASRVELRWKAVYFDIATVSVCNLYNLCNTVPCVSCVTCGTVTDHLYYKLNSCVIWNFENWISCVIWNFENWIRCAFWNFTMIAKSQCHPCKFEGEFSWASGTYNPKKFNILQYNKNDNCDSRI